MYHPLEARLGSWRGVLVPLDGSENAIRALHPGSTLAYSMGMPLYAMGAVTRTLDVEPAKRRMQQQLDRLSVATAGVHVVTAASAIHAIATEATSRSLLVCMASGGHRRVADVVRRRVVAGVVRRLDEPVVVVGPKVTREDGQVGTIYACLDGTPAAKAILPAVAALARHTGATIHLISVVRPTLTVFDLMEYSASTGPADRQSYLSQLAASSQAEQIVSHQVIEARLVASSIIDLVRADLGAVVALTSHTRRGLGQLVFGSVAARIVSACPRQVVLLRGHEPRAHWPLRRLPRSGF